MAKTLVAAEQYLHTSYDPDCDYVEGIVEGRNVGELDHGDFQGEFVHWVKTNLRRLGWNAIPELRVQVSPTRYRVPDVTILMGKRPAHGVLKVAPFAVVEVLSPEDRMTRVQTRMDDYVRLGIPHCWLVDPEARRAWRFADSGSVELRDLVLRAENPSFVIPLKEIFAEMDSQTEGR